MASAAKLSKLLDHREKRERMKIQAEKNRIERDQKWFNNRALQDGRSDLPSPRFFEAPEDAYELGDAVFADKDNDQAVGGGVRPKVVEKPVKRTH